MYRFGCVIACLFGACGLAAAASPNPKDLAVPPAELSRARELVRKLGSEEYEAREEAQEELAKMGRLAYPALVEAYNASPSPEVRCRCRALLPRAATADLHARLETFLADTECKYEHDLPGWNQFRELAGNTPAARTVFAGLLEDTTNRDLMFAVGGPPGDLANMVAARKQELNQWRIGRGGPWGGPGGGAALETTRREPTVEDVTVLLFSESHADTKFIVAPPRGFAAATSPFIIPRLVTAVGDPGEKGAVYKAVVVHWIDTRQDPIEMYQVMNAAETLGLDGPAVGVAVRLLTAKGATTTHRAQAALALARHDAKQHLPALEALLADETPLPGRLAGRVGNGGQPPEVVQLRDVALGACLLLTGQDPEEYGFGSRARGSAGLRTGYLNWSIPDDKRAEALARWKAWRAEHPDTEKPKPAGDKGP